MFMNDLTKNEELILLSIWRLKDNAYGITIRKDIIKRTERELHYGSLYNTLYMLVNKGLIDTQKSQPESKKGGRSKVLYYMTADGKKALKESQKMHDMAWNGIDRIALDEE